MTEVKIISNPYNKTILFDVRDSESDCWKRLSPANNPGSRLLKEDIVRSFFPFTARRILDILLEDYAVEGTPLKIWFEGTTDEFQELTDLVSSPEYSGKTEIGRTGQILDNARDIVQDTREIFEDLSPELNRSLIRDDQVSQKLEKFSGAVSSQIPVVVFGNYSAGKSTFINALLGQEFLPAESRPTTAFITEIKASPYRDTAKIILELNQRRYRLQIRDGNEITVSGSAEPDAAVDSMLAETEDEQKADLAARVCRILNILNHLSSHAGSDSALNSVVKVEIPYSPNHNGLLNESLVFFDTPGSNTASNMDHTKALAHEMENMSNGLCLVISTYSSLDTVDNAALASSLMSLDALDHRFTGLVINQADNLNAGSVRMPDDLNQRLPQLLDTSLVYFVSSIMGMGSQLSREFQNAYNQEIYDDYEKKFSDPENRYYRQLYKLNYLPSQIQYKNEVQCEEEQNRILANSGLLSIIWLLNEFASKYSAYNKASQSERFLGELSQRVQEWTADAIAEREEIREKARKEYEQKKQQVKDAVKALSAELCDTSKTAYEEMVAGLGQEILSEFSQEALQKSYDIYRREEQSKINEYRTREKQASEFLNQQERERRKPKSDDLLGIAAGWMNDRAKDAQSFVEDLNNSNQDRKRAADHSSEQLVQEVNRQLPEALRQRMDKREQLSAEFWLKQAGDGKQKLLDLVTESEELQPEDRQVLQKVILDYSQRVPFDEKRIKSFRDKDCQVVISIGMFALEWTGFPIWNLNKEIQKSADTALANHLSILTSSHYQSYESWLRTLTDLLDQNLDTFNPTLKDKQKTMAEKQNEIERLQKTQAYVDQAWKQMTGLIDWKQNRNRQQNS